MGKHATTFDEQINLLRSRGMELDLPEEKIKEILGDIGYYRLGFYWHPFEIDLEHNFAPGTKFSTIICLYYLDSDLRNVLIRYINRIEIHFRTKVVYFASNAFKESPTWFADSNHVKKGFITKFEKTYSPDFIQKNKAIKKHHEKYINDRYAPAWKTLEYLTFGAILQLYRNIKDEKIRSEIANSFGVISIKKFDSLIEAAWFLRNASAHGNVLFDLHFPKGIPGLPLLKVENDQRHQVYTGIRVVSFLLNNISENRKSSFETRVKSLFDEVEDEQVKSLIIEKIGFNDFEKVLHK